jgi:hypothetical protein
VSSPTPAPPERVALSQDLSEFLIEFSIALHRTSMYPWGHPSLERAASQVVSRLITMLADRPSISIGVARRQLVIEGVATDPKHPVLRSLAEKLHRHHVGAVVFERGVGTDEVVSMMRLVGAEPERGATPLGLGDPDVMRQWQHVRLYPLTYEQLELINSTGGDDDSEPSEDRDQATRSAQLWIGLARAALAAEEKGVEPESTEPAVVAQAINEHPAAKAYDQVIVGYMLQLAQELKQEGGGTGSAAVRRRLSRLIGALDEDTLKRLIEMGGDLDQRKRFVMDATEALAVDAVVEIVQAAAATTNQTISSSMVRLLTKLSAFAEQGTHLAQMQADTALREQVQLLLQDWTLENPNPDAYTRALESLSRRPQTMTSTATTRYVPEPIRIVQMALEVETVGVPVWRAVAEVMQAEGIAPLMALLHEAGAENSAAQQLWRHLATKERLTELLARDTIDFNSLDPILDRMSAAAIAPVLMETLVESPVRGTRMGVFKRLANMELAILEPLMVERLKDDRWYVRRNMLALLNEKNAISDVVTLAPLARHTDARVRREALQLWMRTPNERDRAVCVALTDADERALRLAIAEAQRKTPESAAPLIAKRLHEDLPSELKVQLVRLLTGLRNAVALDALLRTAAVGKTFLGKPKLAPKSPEMMAALKVMRTTWPQDQRARAILERAQKAEDEEIREAAAGSTVAA